MTLEEEKEKIDYEIQAKKNARNENLSDWGCAGFLAIMFFLIAIIIASIFNN